MKFLNPDIESTFISQPHTTSCKPKKYNIISDVTRYFPASLYIPIVCTLIRISISGFGKIKNSNKRFIAVLFCLTFINTTVFSKDLLVNNDHFIIKDVRFYDGETLFENTDVEIKNNLVFKISSNISAQQSIKIIDGKGKTLLPGLIDAHTHVYGNALKDALNFGVTTELDMFSILDANQGDFNPIENTKKADLFSSSILATAPKGHGTEYGFDIPVLESVDETEKFVADRLKEGASYIKAVYNSKDALKKYMPSISLEILTALIKHTHDNGKILVVHVDNYISAIEAIEAGADGLVHSFMDKTVDEKFIKLMLDNNAFMVPTFTVEAGISQNGNIDDVLTDKYMKEYISKEQKQQLKATFPPFGIPKTAFQTALDSVKLLSDAGITILAGTDAPNPSTTHGISIYQEIELLIRAGLSHEKAIHAATGAAKNYFPIGTRGTLKVGAHASMILVEGNPFVDIKQLRQLQKIWKNGVLIHRVKAKTTQENLPIIKSGLITNFNNNVTNTLIGHGIMPTTDKYAGGNSEVTLSQGKRDDKGNNYLHLSGEIKEGFMFKWSGMSYAIALNFQSGVDLSGVQSINFEAKGGDNTNEISVMLFQTGSFRPITQTIKLSPNWQSYSIKLSDFEGLDTKDVSSMSIAMGNKLGLFEFMLDNLIFK